jgi:hypothetical protein
MPADVCPLPGARGIKADGKVRHSTVVDVLDERRLADVSGLAMAVKAGKKPVG